MPTHAGAPSAASGVVAERLGAATGVGIVSRSTSTSIDEARAWSL